MLLFPTIVLGLEDEFNRPYGELISLSIPGFVAFAAGTLPAGWLGDRWSRSGMMAIFFIGIGIATILTGFAQNTWQIAAGLGLIGIFASIYHPMETTSRTASQTGGASQTASNQQTASQPAASQAASGYDRTCLCTDCTNRVSFGLNGNIFAELHVSYWTSQSMTEHDNVLSTS